VILNKLLLTYVLLYAIDNIVYYITCMTATTIWQAHQYDFNHGFVSEYGKELISILNPQKGQNILDLGCGTADITRVIKDTGANVIGIDSSIEMLEQGKVKYPELDLRCVDVLDMDYRNQFDSIISNAALHWVHDSVTAVKNMNRALKLGGHVVLEFGGHGNISNIQASITNVLYNLGYKENSRRKIWYFPTIGQYASILEDNGFNVTTALLYKRPTLLEGEMGMENWIRQFASGYFDNLYEEQIASVMECITEGSKKRGYQSNLHGSNYKDGMWMADYVRLRIVATKVDLIY
jgi:ubiquinone/menaquinone biosynthesis C-methylase UbiE